MGEPLIHINYSFEDIQRYLQGSMSAAEMHEIEKAALQDPFLADAIEGYTDTSSIITVQKHLNEINAALSKENATSKVVAFNKKTQWLRIAAFVIIIAGVGVTASYLFKSSNPKQEVAQLKNGLNEVKRKDSFSQTINPSATMMDTTSLITRKTLKKSTAAENGTRNGVISADEDSQEVGIEITSMEIPSPPRQNKTNSKTLADTITLNSNNESTQQILEGYTDGLHILANTFSGKVLDQNGDPVPGAYIQSADKKTAAVSNMNGDFSLQKNDTILNVTASTIGYESKAANLETGNKNVIMLRGTSTALNDVVVTTAMGISKKQKVADSATPVGGWKNFNNYVLSQLDKDSTRQNNMSEKDMVELEFLIDNSGKPYDIKITRSLDEQHNSKAIDILKSGPKWTNASKKKKAKVAISF